eukprot:2002686-Pyramimonas_sp.AAC.1
MPGDPAMVRLFVGAYARQMGMGTINMYNYRAASFKCPWSAQWIQASFTVYVDDVADNFDVNNNAASVMAEGDSQNNVITERLAEVQMVQNVSKQENLVFFTGTNAAFLEAKFLRDQELAG